MAGAAKPSNARTTAKPAPKSAAKQPSKRQLMSDAGPDDIELTEEESDRLFEEVARQVKADARSSGRVTKATGELDWDVLDQALSDAGEVDTGRSGWSNGLGLNSLVSDAAGEDVDTTILPSTPSTFKGFGLPPKASTAAAPASSSAAAGSKSAAGAGKPAGKHGPLRIFLYATSVAKTEEAIQGAGLQGQVVVVEELRQCHAVVACKVAKAGSHNRLQQGERTAANLGVPFICVGRKMTADNLKAAMVPVIKTFSEGDGSAASLKDIAASSTSSLRPDGEWKARMVRDLGLA